MEKSASFFTCSFKEMVTFFMWCLYFCSFRQTEGTHAHVPMAGRSEVCVGGVLEIVTISALNSRCPGLSVSSCEFGHEFCLQKENQSFYSRRNSVNSYRSVRDLGLGNQWFYGMKF